MFNAQHFQDHVLMFKDQWLNTVEPLTLKDNATTQSLTLDNKQPATEHTMPEEQSSQLHCFESLKIVRAKINFRLRSCN
jgi:hypothetical protein